MEDKPLLPGSPYLLARLTQDEAYDVCGKSHLVRVESQGWLGRGQSGGGKRRGERSDA